METRQDQTSDSLYVRQYTLIQL
ncbi:hypothetical protein CGLO_18237 [Colletotrichum gloeosporioides Cg-14]|uniref:Uncharacterized protein n=1 Tax=Colletotrichum gloeosporioides (strain Cg-14) TaxID=1237896 RepID=T0L4J2_COLGC|nr:hypothetical protein CGLO_18237 [Colletotrichum gloeosporioides Cg-14]